MLEYSTLKNKNASLKKLEKINSKTILKLGSVINQKLKSKIKGLYHKTYYGRNLQFP